MESLWEQVYQSKRDGSIPGWLQRMEVTGESGGVTGDVDDLFGESSSETAADFGAKARSGRIDYDQLGTARRRRLEEAECVLHDPLMPRSVEIMGEICGGRRRRFDGDDLLEVLGQCLGEEANAGIEIPCNCALPTNDDLLQQGRDQVAIDLKKCASADLVLKQAHRV